MIFENIILGKNVQIDPSSTINNVEIGDNVKIAKYCSIYGGPHNLLKIGANSYVGMMTILNGYSFELIIGQNVSIAQGVNMMTDSGPNASPFLQKIFPILKGSIHIGDHSWVGTQAIIMPGVNLGKFCVVAANSFVNSSFPDFCVIGGSPARLIRYLDPAQLE